MSDVAWMAAYVAKNCDTAINVKVDILDCGAGRIACPECKGTGKSLLPIEIRG